ncbi:MAG: Sec-independent protein translocase subunit TatB [Epsilonproteobacteria bacterium]|nr:Sec-independent protein translocase subunit TatB [Campylobacterota bacterium]
MFGLGFAEILVIVIIAILFLGPDKLPSTMVEIAKFFRGVKRTIADVKDSIEQEMHVSEIKEEALAYKKELLNASDELHRATDMTKVGEEVKRITDDIVKEEEPKKEAPKPAPEVVTFEKKSKIKEDI